MILFLSKNNSWNIPKIKVTEIIDTKAISNHCLNIRLKTGKIKDNKINTAKNIAE